MGGGFGGNFSGGSGGGGGGAADLSNTTNGPLPVADGGTGATTASGARTALGALGTSDQAADAALLGGQNSAYHLDPTNLSAAVNYNKGGTAATSLGVARINLGIDLAIVHGGRLCTSSSDPLDGSAGSVLYYTAWDSEYVSAFFGGSLALALISASTDFDASTDLDLDSASIVADANYDVFVYYSGGAARLALKKWTDDSTRATALARTNGIYYLSGNTTYRFVGTVRTVNDSGVKFVCAGRLKLIDNIYNRVDYRYVGGVSGVSPYAVGTAGPRTLNNANYDGFNHEFVAALTQDVECTLKVMSQLSSGGYVTMVYFDGAESGDSATRGRAHAAASLGGGGVTQAAESAAPGYHTWQAYEEGTGSSTVYVSDYSNMLSRGKW